MKRINELKAKAKKKIASRYTIQFRCDEELLFNLMTIADKKKLPVGVLARMWIAERLEEESFDKTE